MHQTKCINYVNVKSGMNLDQSWRSLLFPVLYSTIPQKCAQILAWILKMASYSDSSDADIVESPLCSTCGKITKYTCISCPTVICCNCPVFEVDGEAEGWVARRSVGYCKICSEERTERWEEPRSQTPPPASRKRYLLFLCLTFSLDSNKKTIWDQPCFPPNKFAAIIYDSFSIIWQSKKIQCD